MTTAVREGVGLAAAWRLLSLGLAPPGEETLLEIEALAEALLEVDASPEIADVLEAVRHVEPGEAAAQYSALFRGKVLVAPYEGSYELDPTRLGRQMSDVAAFYRAFGAEAHGPAAERPDFVGCELEFLSFLELRRLAAVEADEEGVDILEGLRDSFLADHAGRWLPTFFTDVGAAAESPSLYGSLAVYGMSVLGGELERLGIAPPSLPRRPDSSLDADMLECGGADEPAPAL
jgi:nitrate reductase assembly molybdenum cofactor insertion protein NarJ